MSCEFETRVSQWIDGELPSAEAGIVKDHLGECDFCRKLEQDFLDLGQAVRSYAPELTRSSGEVLREVTSGRPTRFWSRPVPVPMSWAIAALLALFSLGAWTAYQQARGETSAGTIRLAEPTHDGLDRFDRGERAVLYKVRDEAL